MKKLFSAALFCIFSALVFANPDPVASKTEATAARLANDKNFQNLINFKLNLATQLKATQSVVLLEKLGNKQISAEEKKLLAVNLKYKDVADMDASFTAAGKSMKNLLSRYGSLKDKEIMSKTLQMAARQSIQSRKITAKLTVMDDCWVDWAIGNANCFAIYQLALACQCIDETDAFLGYITCTAAVDLRLIACV